MQLFSKRAQGRLLVALCISAACIATLIGYLVANKRGEDVQVADSGQHPYVGMVRHRFCYNPITQRRWNNEWSVRVVRRGVTGSDEVLMDSGWRPYHLLDARWDGQSLVVDCGDPRPWSDYERETPDWSLRFRLWGR